MLPRFLCQTQGVKENEISMAILLSFPPPPPWCTGHCLESLTRKHSYPNFEQHQICVDLQECWVGHKVGSRGTAQPRKVGQPKPSISSAAQTQSKNKREEREKQGRQEQRRPQRGGQGNQRPMSPFSLSAGMKLAHAGNTGAASELVCDKEQGIENFPKHSTDVSISI